MRIVLGLAGLMAVLLGGLWFLQGSGVVHLRPILCFADCAPLQGPSLAWCVVGLAVAIAGGLAVGASLNRRRR